MTFEPRPEDQEVSHEVLKAELSSRGKGQFKEPNAKEFQYNE